jgi:DNA-binding FadR family transcriptional regulator
MTDSARATSSTAHSDWVSDKLAERIAATLEADIMRTGWKVGEPLGNEEQLVRRFGVGRWVVREAIAIMERDGLARMQRGCRGGLVVSQPAESVVANVAANYLLLAGTESDHIVAARRALDILALRLAARRASVTQRAHLVELVQMPVPASRLEGARHGDRLYQALLHASGNEAVAIFGKAFSQLAVARGIYRKIPALLDDESTHPLRRLREFRQAQIRHVLRGDADGAIALQAELDRIWTDLFSITGTDSGSRMGARSRLQNKRLAEFGQPPKNLKRSDMVSLQIQAAIASGEARPGDFIASEAELMKRYKVGRAVLREAIRHLERHGFAVASEGRYGGLRVGVPRPDFTIRSIVLYLKFLNISASQLLELGAAFELATVSAIADRALRSEAGFLQPLKHAVARIREEGAAPDSSILDYYKVLGERASNPVFALAIRAVGAPLVVEGGGSPKGRRALLRYVSCLDDMVAALTAGDAAAARVRLIDAWRHGLLLRPHERGVEELMESLQTHIPLKTVARARNTAAFRNRFLNS